VAYKIQVRRGLKQDLPTLDNGELGLAQDTQEVFVGGPEGNIELTSQGKLKETRDPLAFLNSVEVLCKFSARGQSTDAWIQGFSINETTNEIYAAIQRNDGATGITIEIRDLKDGSFKESKTFTIESGAFTESLPFFYNGLNELCFIVHTQNVSSYAIYNYTTGTLGSPVVISGNRAKGDVDGSYFVTCDTTASAPYTMKTIYIYDWDSIKSGTPTLLNSFRVDNYGDLVQKAQGIVVNNGFIFLTQGESNGNPAITVYNTAGQLVNAYMYTKESLASAINHYFPNDITDISTYSYENEGGCKYKGKLATAHLANSIAYITVHNSLTGKALETKVPVYRIDTGWQDVTLLNGAINYGDSTTTPRIRRIGNQIILTGAIKGFTVLNQEFIEFYSGFAPDRNFQTVQVTSNGKTSNWQIQPNGRARILNTTNTTLDVENWYPFHITWFI
jgi:hypothetical protein